MPKPHASASGGPTVGPASSGDARNSAAGDGDARHPVVRAPQGVWSDPRAASTPSSAPRTTAAEPTPLEAQKVPSAGMFDAVPMFGAVPRPIGTLGERPPVGMLGERAPGGVADGAAAPISNYEVAYVTPAPLTTAAGPVLGPPPGATADGGARADARPGGLCACHRLAGRWAGRLRWQVGPLIDCCRTRCSCSWTWGCRACGCSAAWRRGSRTRESAEQRETGGSCQVREHRPVRWG